MRQKFIIYKMEPTKKSGARRMYLTAAFTWSKEDSRAYTSNFEAMKAIAVKIKDQNPDLIIERLDGYIERLDG